MSRSSREGKRMDTNRPRSHQISFDFGAMRREAPGRSSTDASLGPAENADPSFLEKIRRLPPLPPAVRFGTSSWNYPGWIGQIYHGHYPRRGDASAMLKEYVRCPLFRCVGMDSTFYRPAEPHELARWHAILPPHFEALAKVWERITIYKYAKTKRAGENAGRLNPDFLNASLCRDRVVGPWLEHMGERAGPLIFEFQAMHPPHRPDPSRFGDMLCAFFDRLPAEGRYSIELRTPDFLTEDYLDTLSRLGVAHVFNSWTGMPSIGEQLRLGKALTTSFVPVRALLRPGRRYAHAVERFTPYDRIREIQTDVRADIVRLMRRGLARGVRLYVLVNNRLEGNAPETIAALWTMLAQSAEAAPGEDVGPEPPHT